MNIRTWLRSLFRPRPSKPSPPKIASIVLIDMLNVTNRDKYAEGPRLHIVWSALRTRLLLELANSTPLEEGLRAYFWPDRDERIVSRWLSQARPSWEAAGYTLIAKPKDDTDSQIVGAMSRLVARAVLMHYDRVRVIIVSGDGIFGEEFQALKDEYEGKISLDLIVFAWSSALSVSLGRVCTQFRSLESVSGLVRQ